MINPIAIEGYSPVSYFEKGVAEKEVLDDFETWRKARRETRRRR